jgi:hypothetical protein
MQTSHTIQYYASRNPPTTTPIAIPKTGFLSLGAFDPVCNDPPPPVDVALVAETPLTTAVDVIVVTAPFGSVDVNVDVRREVALECMVVPLEDCDVTRVVREVPVRFISIRVTISLSPLDRSLVKSTMSETAK